MQVDGNDLVLVRLVDGNVAKHPIGYAGTRYGQRQDGDEFYVLAAHVDVLPVERVMGPASVPAAADEGMDLVEPTPINASVSTFDDSLLALYDWTEDQLQWLQSNSIRTAADIRSLGVARLIEMKGIGPARAEEIYRSAEGDA